MGKISACILTKNEEKNIGRCLQNIAPYVDEIVIVDGFSEDKTVEIARKYTDKIYQKEFSGSFAVERNYGIEKASNDWVFIVDADELPTKELMEKIEEKIKNSRCNGYAIIRKDITPDGKVVEYDYPRIPIRIARKNKIRFYGRVHEIPIVKGRRGFISEILYHYKDEKYSKEKEERFEKLAEKDKITHKTLNVRKNLFINSIKNIILYFFAMYIGMNYNLTKSIKLTFLYVSDGFKKLKRRGKI